MAEEIKIEIVSPERLLMSAVTNSVTIPGAEGYFTVVGDHAAVMSVLKPGFVTVGEGSAVETFYVRGGLADVNAGLVTILAEEATDVSDFDKAAIEEILVEARARLGAAQDDIERDAAQLLVHSFENLLEEVKQMGPAVSM